MTKLRASIKAAKRGQDMKHTSLGLLLSFPEALTLLEHLKFGERTKLQLRWRLRFVYRVQQWLESH